MFIGSMVNLVRMIHAICRRQCHKIPLTPDIICAFCDVCASNESRIILLLSGIIVPGELHKPGS